MRGFCTEMQKKTCWDRCLRDEPSGIFEGVILVRCLCNGVSVVFFWKLFVSLHVRIGPEEVKVTTFVSLLLWSIKGFYESQSVYTCACVSPYVHHHVCFDMLSFCQACGFLMWYVCLWILVWYFIYIHIYLAWIDNVPGIAWTEFDSIKVTCVSLKGWTDKQKSAAGLFRVFLVSTMLVDACCIYNECHCL